MSDYALLIASVIVCCLLAAVLLMYLHCRRMKRNCNMMIVEYLREHDRLTKELERTRIEKDTIEKLLKTYLSEATK
ncbi:hypothetical protein [Bacteroides cellulosilyticus]|uniref:hypothetical protein n=1 Tax=Bacteroides cellulosilyticus TaxID=246787 RepID=UPI0035658CE4